MVPYDVTAPNLLRRHQEGDAAGIEDGGNGRELATGTVLQYPNWSLDSKYAYFEDLGADGPEIDRVSVVTRKKERVTCLPLKGISRVSMQDSGVPWNGVAPMARR